jgi:signal transduction histidine kinase
MGKGGVKNEQKVIILCLFAPASSKSGQPLAMFQVPSLPGKAGLVRGLVVPFSVFVLLGTFGMLVWIETLHRRESLLQFAETARANANFVERLRLPSSPELARNLSEVLGVAVGFRFGEGEIDGVPAEVRSALTAVAVGQEKALREGRWEVAQAPIRSGEEALVLLREADPIAPGRGILPALIIALLGGALAMLVARRIVIPLTLLTKWLPNLDRDVPEILPREVMDRNDEIGTLARSLVESHRRLREETDRRRQSERLAALGRIATSLAHEIRNPAAAIRMHADLLAAGADSGSRNSIALIREEVDRITDLVNQWLFVARAAPPKTERHDLVALVRRVLNRLGPQFDYAGVSVFLSGAGSALVEIDGPRIEQVVRNLLINAVQAMPEGGAVVAEVRDEGGCVVLEVADGGRGFSGEALDRWSEPFFSEREGGMGLGLTLAAEVMSGHGGCVEVSNRPEGGARVRCRFPIPDKPTGILR